MAAGLPLTRGDSHIPRPIWTLVLTPSNYSRWPQVNPPAPHFVQPSRTALQLTPILPVPPQPVQPQPVSSQPNPNYHIPTPHPVPTASIPPDSIPPPTSQAQSGTTAPPIPAQPHVSQSQQPALPFRFDLQDPPLTYIFGSAANHQSTNNSAIVPRLGKRNRPVDEDPKKIRVIRHPSVSITISVFNYC